MNVDEPNEVRNGEELDINSLRSHLCQHLSHNEELTVSQFPSGFSNLTYLLNFGTNEYVLRRPPFGANIKSGHDMSREYRFLTALSEPFKKVPKPVLFCDDESVIGAPFYLMERVKGVILRGHLTDEARPSVDSMQAIAEASISTLVELHKIDIVGNALENLGKPEGYVSRQVSGWSERYRKAQTDAISEMDEIAIWLEKNQPTESGSSLIHNDFKYDNLVLNPHDTSNVIAVLDWEMATIGDPLMDLGTTLGYWVEANDPQALKELNLSPSHWPGNPNRMQVAEKYASLTGADLRHLVFYYVQGLFKIAVIVQQIYYRFQKGHTKDPRFSNLIHAVKGFGRLASQAIKKNKISELGS